MKDCPFCGEKIQDIAVKCRFCGEWLSSSDLGPPDGSGMAPASPQASALRIGVSESSTRVKECPRCAMLNPPEAAVCLCGHSFGAPQADQRNGAMPSGLRSSGPEPVSHQRKAVGGFLILLGWFILELASFLTADVQRDHSRVVDVGPLFTLGLALTIAGTRVRRQWRAFLGVGSFIFGVYTLGAALLSDRSRRLVFLSFLGSAIAQIVFGLTLIAWAKHRREITIRRALSADTRREIYSSRPRAVPVTVTLLSVGFGIAILDMFEIDRSWMPPEFPRLVLLAVMVTLIGYSTALVVSIWKGMNWARILVAGSFSIAVAMNARRYTDVISAGGLTAATRVIELAVNAVGVGLLFASGSNVWFKLRKAARSGRVIVPATSARDTNRFSRRTRLFIAILLSVAALVFYQEVILRHYDQKPLPEPLPAPYLPPVEEP